uniref:Uncharacterized protein n=1 Tax=Opuntia streptacantha TaxID=393608 RepID=A0A7C8YN92_OPUST
MILFFLGSVKGHETAARFLVNFYILPQLLSAFNLCFSLGLHGLLVTSPVSKLVLFIRGLEPFTCLMFHYLLYLVVLEMMQMLNMTNLDDFERFMVSMDVPGFR